MHGRQGDTQRLGQSQRADLIVGEFEGLYVVVLERDPFQFVVPKAAISGQESPSVFADKWEPFLVRRPAREEFQVPMHLNSVARQHFEYRLAVAQVFIEVNVELRGSCAPT